MDQDKIKQEMLENTAMQEYFRQFTGSAVDGFVKSYASYKSMWLNYGKTYIQDKENYSIQWVSRAAKHLEIIQQKKLFDAQCLWRAEKLDIPEVQLCYDFQIWEKDILNCRFIEPVSEDDIELYSQYLLSGQAEIEIEMHWHCFEKCQEHDEIIEAYKSNNAKRNFPEWYDFYNGRRGTGVYMTLPDIRGDKEEFYMDLIRQENKRKAEAENKPKQTYTPIKFLSYYDKEQRDWFINTFESKEVREYYEAFEWKDRNSGLEEDLEPYLRTLYEAEDPVSMEPHMNWAEALRITAKKYTCRKIAEALPEAWEQYMINIQMNIAFPTDEERLNHKDHIRKMYEDGIKEGRKLNGEPADLDF